MLVGRYEGQFEDFAVVKIDPIRLAKVSSEEIDSIDFDWITSEALEGYQLQTTDNFKFVFSLADLN